MTDQQAALPFEALSFSLSDESHGTASFRLTWEGDGLYRAAVSSTAGGRTRETERKLPLASAQELFARLSELGAFRWDEEYPARVGEPIVRWRLGINFKTKVYSQVSQGSSTPPRFDDLLEALYALDFPRPERRPEPSSGARSGGWLGSGLGEGSLFSGLGAGVGSSSFASVDPEAMREAMEHFMANPGEFQDRIRAEFHAMSPEQQELTIDALVHLGGMDRSWWERFFEGDGTE